MALVNNENCYKKSGNWENVTLADFMGCKSNLANNRQTRMLALFDSEFDLCPDSTSMDGYDEELLRRAKKTLDSLIFFAINEQQHLSIRLFEKDMDSSRSLFRFQSEVEQLNNTIAGSLYDSLPPLVHEKIRHLNYLDNELYNYALKIFFEKVKLYKL